MTYNKPEILHIKPLVIAACKNGTCNGASKSKGFAMLTNEAQSAKEAA